MVQGDDTLVGKENLPLVPLDGVFGAARRRREQSLSQGFGKRTTGYGDLEGAMTGDASVLALDHVGAQGRGEGGDTGERKEIGLAVVTHGSGGMCREADRLGGSSKDGSSRSRHDVVCCAAA